MSRNESKPKSNQGKSETSKPQSQDAIGFPLDATWATGFEYLTPISVNDR